ncbi:MAG: response regulator transcription factor [Planctomycetes bacterium]|nr:response regulator transcription factor [Planctomycetota bacterium]
MAIVDDHPLVRAGLRRVLEAEGDLVVCGEAGTGRQALALARRGAVDAFLVDLSLPDVGGLDLLRRLAEACPGARLLVLTMHDEGAYADRCLRAGAHGFLQKTESPRALVGALRRVLDGGYHLSETTLRRVLGRLASRGGGPGPPGGVEALTDRELEVFELYGGGLGTREIARRLHRSPKTIDSHRCRIRVKLGLDPGTGLVHRATRWVVEGPGGPGCPARTP